MWQGKLSIAVKADQMLIVRQVEPCQRRQVDEAPVSDEMQLSIAQVEFLQSGGRQCCHNTDRVPGHFQPFDVWVLPEKITAQCPDIVVVKVQFLQVRCPGLYVLTITDRIVGQVQVSKL